MKISIIIPTFKREKILQRTLDAANSAVEKLEAEIIIVNDGPDYCELASSGKALIINNPGRGVSSARNYGFSKSSGDIIVFLDNDILISEKILTHFISLLADNPQCIFNPNWEYPDDLKKSMQTNQFGRFLLETGNYCYKAWAQDVNWGTGPLIKVDKLATFCLIMERSVFEKTGGFDEKIFFGEEDLEMTIRAKKLGFELYIDESVIVYHNEVDRVTLTNKLTRMRIVGAMLKSNGEFTYPQWKKAFLWIQLKLSFLILSVMWFLPNRKFFDKLYFFLAHSLLASTIYDGYTRGYHGSTIQNTYSKLK